MKPNVHLASPNVILVTVLAAALLGSAGPTAARSRIDTPPRGTELDRAGATLWDARPDVVRGALDKAAQATQKSTSAAGSRLAGVAAGAPMGREPARAILAKVVSTRLTFRYASGWTTGERAAIAHFITVAYPIMVAVYGPPAASFVVTIVPDDTLSGTANFQHSTRLTTAGWRVIDAVIHVGHADVADANGRLAFLPHEILHAFHAPYGLARDADEEGLAEAAGRVVAARVAPLIGVDSYRAEPSALWFNGRSISGLVGSDQMNDPVLAAPSFYNSNHVSRPQIGQMYSAAAAYWMTLIAQRPTFLRDFNVRWYRSPARMGTISAQAKAVEAIVSALVPRVGTAPFAAWRNQQQITRSRHSVGIHLLCTDIAPQLSDAGTIGSPAVTINADLVVTTANGDDRRYQGPVNVTITGPDGVVATQKSGETSNGSLFSFGLSQVAIAGAYRFQVTAPGPGGASSTQGCWAVAGVTSAGRLLVIGTPGESVTATVAKRDAASGIIGRVAETQLIDTNGISIFEGVQPGFAEVRLTGALPSKVVPIGLSGAIVALISANSSAPPLSR